MRQPLATKNPRGIGTVSIVRPLPAPVGGWNARDPLARMDPRDAITLDNWFPRVTDCSIRGGCANHVTGMAARAKTLAVYTPGTPASNKMFASTASGVYDATTAGAVGVAVAARTEGYHVWFQMSVSGGHYLMMFNGTDKPLYYDGTTWTAVDAASTPALTGVTTTSLIGGCTYKRRLFLLEKDKLNFWYLAADAVGGALTQFLLGPLCLRGGYTMACMNWSFDGGSGPDDYLAFVTSEGEVLVFTGTNPSSATDWLLKGVYYVGKPLGRRCMQKFGGDLVVITQNGAFPLSQALLSSSIDYKLALTNKIDSAFGDAAMLYGAQQGWEGCLYPAQNAVIFNVPQSTNYGTMNQYVMNTITKAWCKFSGWNASCFVEFNKEIYFADETVIAKAWIEGTRADYGANIIADAQTAYTNFGTADKKHVLMFMPMLLVDGALSFSVGIAVDFQQLPALSTATYNVVAGAVWDSATWDSGYWAAGLEIQKDWQSPRSVVGEYVSALLRVPTNALEVQWAANDYLFEMGGAIG